jgi:hypothetical protein
MKLLSFSLAMLASTSVFAQGVGDAEVICNGFKFSEVAGIMSIKGEVKNNTPVPFKNFKVRIEFLKVKKVVGSVLISTQGLDAGEQELISARTESIESTWNDYRMSFYDGTTPLLWRLPRQR